MSSCTTSSFFAGDGIDAALEHDRYRRGGSPCHQHRDAVRGDDGGRPADQLGRQGRQAVIAILTPKEFDLDVLVLGEAGLSQALAKRFDDPRIHLRRPAMKKADHRYSLPRRCRNRPQRSTTENDNEIPSSHPHPRL
jgi:hypothetical protein